MDSCPTTFTASGEAGVPVARLQHTGRRTHHAPSTAAAVPSGGYLPDLDHQGASVVGAAGDSRELRNHEHTTGTTTLSLSVPLLTLRWSAPARVRARPTRHASSLTPMTTCSDLKALPRPCVPRWLIEHATLVDLSANMLRCPDGQRAAIQLQPLTSATTQRSTHATRRPRRRPQAWRASSSHSRRSGAGS